MDLFGIGGSELLVLLFLAGVLLGPQRLVRLARDMGKFLGQIRAMTGDLTKQLNREVDLLEVAEGKSSKSGKSEAQGPETARSSADKVPEAYRRFREDFPNEGRLDHLSDEAGRGSGQASQPSQPIGTPSVAKPGDAGAAVAPGSLSPGKG
ncbi:MAG: Sec-independent protein translocase subunit TatA/TatB [Anaerolineales bacterium]